MYGFDDSEGQDRCKGDGQEAVFYIDSYLEDYTSATITIDSTDHDVKKGILVTSSTFDSAVCPLESPNSVRSKCFSIKQNTQYIYTYIYIVCVYIRGTQNLAYTYLTHMTLHCNTDGHLVHFHTLRFKFRHRV